MVSLLNCHSHRSLIFSYFSALYPCPTLPETPPLTMQAVSHSLTHRIGCNNRCVLAYPVSSSSIASLTRLFILLCLVSTQAVPHDTRSFPLPPPPKPLPSLQTQDGRGSFTVALSTLTPRIYSGLNLSSFDLAIVPSMPTPSPSLQMQPQLHHSLVSHHPLGHSCFREPTLSVPVHSSPNQCLVPTSLARAASQADQLGSR
jgi:hypothetical protein